jgi:hypothetical protein
MRSVQCWSKPSEDRLKINSDGAFLVNEGNTGDVIIAGAVTKNMHVMLFRLKCMLALKVSTQQLTYLPRWEACYMR